jgi:hypothetical protein
MIFQLLTTWRIIASTSTRWLSGGACTIRWCRAALRAIGRDHFLFVFFIAAFVYRVGRLTTQFHKD